MKVTSKFRNVSVGFILQQCGVAALLESVEKMIERNRFPDAVAILNDRNVWAQVGKNDSHKNTFTQLCERIFSNANPNSDCYEIAGTLATMFAKRGSTMQPALA